MRRTLEQRSDRFAQARIDHFVRGKTMEQRRAALEASPSVCPIDHIINESSDVLAYLADFEAALFGEVSAAYQAGFKAGAAIARRK